MRIRPARASDLPTLAATAAAAYVDCDIDTFLCPRRKEHPEAYQSYYSFTLGCEMDDEGFSMMVAEGKDGSEGWKIVGFACWLRTGDDKNPESKSEGRTNWNWKGLKSQCRQLPGADLARGSIIFRSRHNSAGLFRLS